MNLPPGDARWPGIFYVIYNKYRPGQLDNLPNLLSKYYGLEKEWFEGLSEAYDLSDIFSPDEQNIASSHSSSTSNSAEPQNVSVSNSSTGEPDEEEPPAKKKKPETCGRLDCNEDAVWMIMGSYDGNGYEVPRCTQHA